MALLAHNGLLKTEINGAVIVSFCFLFQFGAVYLTIRLQ